MSKKLAEAERDKCRAISNARKDYFEHCPHLSCPCKKERAVCKSGRCVMESGNLEVVKRYVREGLGWSIVPEMALGPADLKRLVVRDLPGLPARRIVVVRRKDRAPGPLTTALLELMARHLLDGGPSAS